MNAHEADIRQCFSISQTIVVSVESIQALGQHIGDLSPNQFRIFQKVQSNDLPMATSLT